MSTRHLITASEISKQELCEYIRLATQMRSQGAPQHPDKTLITMFYEPSTRTNCSFQAAAHRLGSKVIALTDKASSSEKGESLEDTIRTLQYYGNAIVLRHPEKGSAYRSANISRIPIINGGDGNGEHPTQALLDIFTIHSELARRSNISIESEERQPITIVFAGDLKNSRTIHSLIRLLAHFPNLRFIYVSPPSLGMPQEIVDSVRFDQNKMVSISDAIEFADVLYMTRIQKERFDTEDAYNMTMMDFDHKYKLTPDLLKRAKEQMIIMHPLPRLSEIPTEIDSDNRAVYFTQVENGVYMRMAILHRLFSV